MNKLMRTLAMALVVIATTATTTFAADKPRLKAGTAFTVTFPEMPPTFYALWQKKDVKAQMTVFLPFNYQPGRKYPLLVFLYGGDGENGPNPGIARSLCEGKDFVCVSVPLFKATDPKAPGSDYIFRAADAKYMWPFFRTMLARLDEMVPNIDPAHQVLGGFSNGAHAAAGLLDQSDGDIARRFSAFFFVEGGGRLEHYELLKGKRYLMVCANSKARRRGQEICDASTAAGAKTTLIIEDTGKHEFPVAAYPKVGDWLREAVKE